MHDDVCTNIKQTHILYSRDTYRQTDTHATRIHTHTYARIRVCNLHVHAVQTRVKASRVDYGTPRGRCTVNKECTRTCGISQSSPLCVCVCVCCALNRLCHESRGGVEEEMRKFYYKTRVLRPPPSHSSPLLISPILLCCYLHCQRNALANSS